MTILSPPSVVHRPAQATLAIRASTPFPLMAELTDSLVLELTAWAHEHQVALAGHPHLRLLVVAMDAVMEIEVGVPTAPGSEIPPDERVVASELPGGTYATVTFVDDDIESNGLLLNWITANGYQADSYATPDGEVFACRYEVLLDDTVASSAGDAEAWQGQRIELNIKLRD